MPVTCCRSVRSFATRHAGRVEGGVKKICEANRKQRGAGGGWALDPGPSAHLYPGRSKFFEFQTFRLISCIPQDLRTHRRPPLSAHRHGFSPPSCPPMFMSRRRVSSQVTDTGEDSGLAGVQWGSDGRRLAAVSCNVGIHICGSPSTESANGLRTRTIAKRCSIECSHDGIAVRSDRWSRTCAFPQSLQGPADEFLDV